MKEIKFTGTGITKLTIGDPWYLETIENKTTRGSEKKLVFIKDKIAKSMELSIRVKEETVDLEDFNFEEISIDIIGLRHTLTDKNKKGLQSAFENGKFHPTRVKTQNDLACDTAQFIIETDKDFIEINTGGDGDYGFAMWYKDNDAMWVHISLDAEMVDFDEIVQDMQNLFGCKQILLENREQEQER